jgi:hypothetical protein
MVVTNNEWVNKFITCERQALSVPPDPYANQAFSCSPQPLQVDAIIKPYEPLSSLFNSTYAGAGIAVFSSGVYIGEMCDPSQLCHKCVTDIWKSLIGHDLPISTFIITLYSICNMAA